MTLLENDTAEAIVLFHFASLHYSFIFRLDKETMNDLMSDIGLISCVILIIKILVKPKLLRSARRLTRIFSEKQPHFPRKIKILHFNYKN